VKEKVNGRIGLKNYFAFVPLKGLRGVFHSLVEVVVFLIEAADIVSLLPLIAVNGCSLPFQLSVVTWTH